MKQNRPRLSLTGETQIIEDLQETLRLGRQAIEEAKEEIVMNLASEKAILRNTELFGLISERQRKTGLRVRILAPKVSPKAVQVLPAAEWRRSRSSDMTLMIFDRKTMFFTLYADKEADSTGKAVSSNIYTTNPNTIFGMVSIFDSLWRESELREEAELLQDILAHDIRNYFQVVMSSADLLRSKERDSESIEQIEKILEATRRSALLIDNTKNLGRIAAEMDRVRLQTVDLSSTLRKCVEVLNAAYPGGFLINLKTVESAKIIADDLLDEVFMNILSNSIRHSEGMRTMDIRVEAADDNQKYWKVTIEDNGRGIPDEMKETLFTRYLDGARGSGLGLSIVYALVVERYSGRVRVMDRVEGDHTKGTAVEVLLPAG